MNKFSQKNVLVQSLTGVMMIFSLVGVAGCNLSSNIIQVFKDSGVPETEYWRVESVDSGGRVSGTEFYRLTVKKRLQKRTLQLCGVDDLIPEAKSYLQQQIKQSPETLPVVFAWKDEQGIWYGDVWVGEGDTEESATGLLLYNGLAKLSEDYSTCFNGDALKLAENLAREQKLGVWADGVN